MTQQIFTHQFANGLTLLAESMDWLESAAFSLLLPAGCAYDPLDRLGLSNFRCEMVRRGCGDRTARQFVDDLENLGVDRSASVGTSHTSYGGAMPADSLYPALEIHADLVQRPLLPEEQLDEGRQVC
ncbi:MAG: insulinase family protein, partial [Planctomycetales bacterium]|nr:insulinase family protein [Planctomycetales bacterium]